MRQGCILIQHSFNVYTDSVIRQAYIEELGIMTGGKAVYTLRNADDIALNNLGKAIMKIPNF